MLKGYPNIRNFVVLLLAFSLFGAVLLSFAAMRHTDGMSEAAKQGQQTNCFGQTTSSGPCLEYHLSLMNEVSSGLPVFSKQALEILVLAGFALFSIFNLGAAAINNYRHVLSRLRQIRREAKSYCYRQLGFWLSLLERRYFIRNFLRPGVLAMALP